MNKTFQLSDNDWTYLAEGNQHLILRYDSKPMHYNELLNNKVLKVEKIYNQKDPEVNLLQLQSFNTTLNNYIRENVYVLTPGLPQYLPFEDHIQVSNKTDFLFIF